MYDQKDSSLLVRDVILYAEYSAQRPILHVSISRLGLKMNV